ncbi:hypothetical protein GCM10023238_11970 [Streptomyces heliomycini]
MHVLSAMNGGVEKTVEEMNAHAEELQALDTHVVSPDGYDAPRQVSSAYDLTLIARSGLQKKDFREYSSTVRAQFPGETKKNKKGKKVRGAFEIQNTNRLLAGDTDVPVYPGIAGVKNGNTTNAGATFTGVAERDGKGAAGHRDEPSKNEHNEVYKETAKLFDWGFEAAGKVEPVGELVRPRSVAQAGARPARPPPPARPGAPGRRRRGRFEAGGECRVGRRRRRRRGRAGHRRRGAGAARGRAFLVNRRWPLPDLVRRRSRP